MLEFSTLAKLPRSVSYTLGSVLLALGAPLGLLVVRAWQANASSLNWLSRELAGDPILYTYLLASTTLVFSCVGFILGRYSERLLQLSQTDPLTMLSNRRSFDAILEQEVARAQRYQTPLSLMLIDVDYFKRINDQLGHASGDRALCQIAACMRKVSRASDMPARLGGDEFALLLPATSVKGASVVGNRLRAAVAKSCTALTGGPAITLSIGLAQLHPGADDSKEQLSARADEATYRSKASGRDRVTAYAAKPTSAGSAIPIRRETTNEHAAADRHNAAARHASSESASKR